jgi:chloride channel protein, CIC family
VLHSPFLFFRAYEDNPFLSALKRRGIDIHSREEVDVLEKVMVGDVMTHDYRVVGPDMPVNQLRERFADSHYHSFPVVNERGNLKGMVSLTDMEANVFGTNRNLVVGDISTTNLILAYPDESLHEVLHRLGDRDLARISVVDRRTSSHLLGILRRNDIVAAYTKAIAGSSKE